MVSVPAERHEILEAGFFVFYRVFFQYFFTWPFGRGYCKDVICVPGYRQGSVFHHIRVSGQICGDLVNIRDQFYFVLGRLSVLPGDRDRIAGAGYLRLFYLHESDSLEF